MAHGVSAWDRHMIYRIKTKLVRIQRPFLLSITGAYRRSPFSALQVITGIIPHSIKLEVEADFIRLTRLKQDITINGTKFKAENYEVKAGGWNHHPAISFDENTISTEEDLSSVGQINIYPMDP
ncbi:hypothetical protein AVEN_264017-1 [Araneus ventricosus]|uniref:Uncharacterized protein n=1 Tax=Araneus ventricosus TaxID=182803 RepID=A0A4Y2K3R3_ARAVE|nr:hypothetical protein AVEN_264017-1 [Araneus ventricosus]